MNGRILLALMACLAPLQVRADISPAQTQPADHVCRQAVAAAERAHRIPAHLLAAVARVESGRRDQASGAFNPWPWTINFDGAGSFYDNKVQAVASAVSLQPRVTRSIDVGCMQISLTNHPNAFTGMEQAFDPMSNADYAGRFLVQLYGKSGSWPKAVALYHSATPDLGLDYQQKVYAAWPEEQKLAEASEPTPLSTAWAATVNRSLLIAPPRPGASHIMQQTPGLNGAMTPGRTLESYRASPVRLVFRIP